MTDQELLDMLKLNIGITSTRQDPRLRSILEGLKQELKDRQGIVIDISRIDHALFLLDYATYRYSNQKDPMPDHLKWRMRNLYVGVPYVQS